MSKRVLTAFHELKQDLAGRYRSTAGTQPAVDPDVIERDLAGIERDGFVVIDGLLAADEVAAIRADLLPRFSFAQGRNSFEGFATQRLYALLAKTTVCDRIAEHPRILALLDRLLEPNYLLSGFQAINIRPGEAAQLLHYDDGTYPVPRPRPALAAATIVAIDAFTADNGATVVLPGSHRWDDRTPTDADARHPVVMPAGSAVFFVGTLWHGGGANRTDRARLAVTAQYCAPWCRQQENMMMAIPRARARALSAHLQRMIGYSIHPPFVGFVDGMHPKRLLEGA